MFWMKNTIFFKGCMIRTAYQEIGDLWIKILRFLGINVISIPEERCCGSPLKNAGAFKDFEENAKKVIGIMRRFHAGKVITACPACAYNLSQYLDIPVYHVTQVILDNLKKKNLKPLGIKVVFHDPCHLARYLNVVDEPRKILNLCGCDIIEPELSGKFTYCCGGGGGLPANHPEVAEKIGKERIRQLSSTKADVIVTSCPMCLHQLKKYASIDVLDLSEIIAKSMEVRE